MSLPVVLRPEARAEFDDAFDWYEQQRPGQGRYPKGGVWLRDGVGMFKHGLVGVL